MASHPSIFYLCCKYFLPVCFFTRIPYLVLLLLFFVNRSFRVLCLVEEGFHEQVTFIFPVKIVVIIIPDKLPSTALFLTDLLTLLVFLQELFDLLQPYPREVAGLRNHH